MVFETIKAKPLSVRLIPNVDREYARILGLRDDQKSLGLITADNDDSLYVSIDEATKKSNVEVVYVHSFYAGAKHASGKLSGEIIALLAGPSQSDVSAGLDATIYYLTNKALWFSANSDQTIAFFPHVISQSGSYLSKVCNVPIRSSLAYLVAPPLEGLYALDSAVKAAAVRIVSYTAPPSETNFMGVILTGDQSACTVAAEAFSRSVIDVAQNPIQYL